MTTNINIKAESVASMNETGSREKRRVVITGIGAVTPLGNSFPETWKNLLNGVNPCDHIKLFNAAASPCNLAYEIRDFDFNSIKADESVRPFLNRINSFGLSAALEAMASSGISKDNLPVSPYKVGVILGVGFCSPRLSDLVNASAAISDSKDRLPASINTPPNLLTALVADAFGSQGETRTIHTACASSGQAIGEAFEAIKSGVCDVVLTGGADTMIHPLQLATFTLLGAVSRRIDDPKAASRPFDADRDGFVLGEGGVAIILEDLETALRRGASIIAEVCGFGVTESAYRITDLHPDGRGVIEAMRDAIQDAAITNEDIGYINAHGTSTQLNDAVESLAISKLFGASKSGPVVGSTKGQSGHLIAAAGALEFAFTAMTLKEQLIPPSLNIARPDLGMEIRLAGPTAMPLEKQYAMSNSVGFGGTNTCVIARRYDESCRK